jgi:predicted nucleic acid-binding protein
MSKINNIVIDTNDFISAYVFKSKRLEEIIDGCVANQRLCFCKELVDEVIRIMTQRFNQKEEVIDYFMDIVGKSNFFTLTEIFFLESNPKNGYLLSLS